MAGFPNRQSLLQLYQDRGHDALVWYAWRNTMRALADFASQLLLQQAWPKNIVQNTYILLRACLLLAQWQH